MERITKLLQVGTSKWIVAKHDWPKAQLSELHEKHSSYAEYQPTVKNGGGSISCGNAFNQKGQGSWSELLKKMEKNRGQFWKKLLFKHSDLHTINIRRIPNLCLSCENEVRSFHVSMQKLIKPS
ncbi:hypothetical protein ILYODFUR_015858 [Ilyodon furcidens]|uniref:Uncharacterized protein n=1 Tax=Ilyodon furcidens TaxID=33524 RepID=A0ABV0TV02_9TELE